MAKFVSSIRRHAERIHANLAKEPAFEEANTLKGPVTGELERLRGTARSPLQKRSQLRERYTNMPSLPCAAEQTAPPATPRQARLVGRSNMRVLAK